MRNLVGLVVASARFTGPDMWTRMTVYARAGYRCERCGQRGGQIHHRRPRAMGGSCREDTNSPANLLAACADCPTWAESYRAEARNEGWLVPQTGNPAEYAVLVHRSRWVYLTHDGRYSDDPPGGEAP